MNKKTAGLIFAGICLIIAALLLTDTIGPITGAITFAISLALLGGLSKGFGKKKKSETN
jgi:hypothetical protein